MSAHRLGVRSPSTPTGGLEPLVPSPDGVNEDSLHALLGERLDTRIEQPNHNAVALVRQRRLGFYHAQC